MNVRKESCHYEKLSHNISHKDILVFCKDLQKECIDGQLHCKDRIADRIETTSNLAFSVINGKDKITQSEIDKATLEVLSEVSCELLNYDQNLDDPEIETETNLKLVNYVLKNTERNKEGRLVMPHMWNNKILHLLGKNYNLSKTDS